MIIDCGTCAVAGPACSDCVVSVLLGEPAFSAPVAAPDTAMPSATTPVMTEVDDEHAAALEVLAGSGLIPPLRLVPRSQAS